MFSRPVYCYLLCVRTPALERLPVAWGKTTGLSKLEVIKEERTENNLLDVFSLLHEDMIPKHHLSIAKADTHPPFCYFAK